MGAEDTRLFPPGGSEVMQQNPWEIDWTKQGAASAQGGLVPVTGGDPNRELQRRKLEIDLSTAPLDRELKEIQIERGRKELQQDVSDPKLVEAERTAAFLATRIKGGMSDIAAALRENPGAAKPGVGASLAGLFGDDARNWATGPERQRVEAAQLDIVDAALTLGTGAAYTREQLEGYRRAYFPQLGDSDETVADKRERLIRVLEAAKVKAGKAAPQIDEALAAVRGQIPPEVVAPTPSNLVDQLVGRDEGLRVDITDDRRPGETEEAYQQRIARGETDTPVPDLPQRGEGGALETIDAGVRGVADTLTLGLADEIAAAGETIFNGGTMRENLRRERAIDAYDEQHHYLPRITGQVSGGLLLPTFGASSAGQLARVGAGYGGAYGFNSAEGSLTDRLINAGAGATIGAGAGAVFGLIGNHIKPRGGGTGTGDGGTSAVDLMEAARRQGVEPLAADVGGPLTRRVTAGLVQTPFGSGPVIRGAERVNSQAAARLASIAAAEGTPVRQEALGETARKAAQRYIDSSAAEGRRLYETARAETGDIFSSGRKAVESLDAHLAELAPTANTNAPEIAALNRLRADLVDDQGELRRVPIDAIRRLRTGVRAMAQSDELRGSDFQRRAGDVLQQLSEDIAESLPESARDSFRQADRQWAERLRVIDDVIGEVVGRRDGRSAEAVAQKLASMGRGDSAKLRTFLSTVSDEEAGIIRGSLIQELGRASSGQQGASGQAFSLETFLTNWDKLPERTRSTLFKGESRAAIEDLAKIAEGSRNAGRYANYSGTAGASNVSEVGRMASYGFGWGTMGLSFVAENLTGRLLASPAFARALVWMARQKREPAEIARKLGRVANRDPAIAQDILPMREALGKLAAPAAAEEEKDRR